ncbi:DUF6088 family protein [Allomuricauda taeanensis]|uniref:DUF6088 family protein n=1 Tax=Flagellimonas taeanensis TaxID=1005926 RepID=UPI002E7B5494|nr:DUF6088 family protein [Allomuricauda taeanensis]MEE1963913.1 DUF6088 family protein [Allomuricauda taeanensis]
MTIAGRIADKIAELPKDSTFGYADLPILPEEYVTAAKALERLQKKGVIKKLSKGIFYKPKITAFGELRPNEAQILKPYLFEDGKRIAYITGTSLYNQLNLTTQVPSTYKVASAEKRIYINRGTIKAKPVKSYAPVTEGNYRMLGFLDAMKDLNSIPDVNKKSAVLIFLDLLEKMTIKELNELVKYALLYPPRVRALLGALLEQLDKGMDLKALKRSLNPLTTYAYDLNGTALTTQQNWNII